MLQDIHQRYLRMVELVFLISSVLFPVVFFFFFTLVMYNSGKITNTAFLKFHFAELLSAEQKEAKLQISRWLAPAAVRALAMDVPTAGLGVGVGSCFPWPRMRTARSPWQQGKLIGFQLFCNSSDLTNEWRKPIVETEGHTHTQGQPNRPRGPSHLRTMPSEARHSRKGPGERDRMSHRGRAEKAMSNLDPGGRPRHKARTMPQYQPTGSFQN